MLYLQLLIRLFFLLNTVESYCKRKYDTHDNILYIRVDIHKNHAVLQGSDNECTCDNA